MKRGSLSQKEYKEHLQDRKNFQDWMDNRWNRWRFHLASRIFGNEGWQLFYKVYLEYRVDMRVRELKYEIPETWSDAVALLPKHIESLRLHQEQHKI